MVYNTFQYHVYIIYINYYLTNLVIQLFQFCAVRQSFVITNSLNSATGIFLYSSLLTTLGTSIFSILDIS